MFKKVLVLLALVFSQNSNARLCQHIFEETSGKLAIRQKYEIMKVLAASPIYSQIGAAETKGLTLFIDGYLSLLYMRKLNRQSLKRVLNDDPRLKYIEIRPIDVESAYRQDLVSLTVHALGILKRQKKFLHALKEFEEANYFWIETSLLEVLLREVERAPYILPKDAPENMIGAIEGSVSDILITLGEAQLH